MDNPDQIIERHMEYALEHIREALYVWQHRLPNREHFNEHWLSLSDIADRTALLVLEVQLRQSLLS